MSDWHEIDAAWDDLGYASTMLLALGETKQWSELVREAAECTHFTVEEVWDGMAAAVRRYLESLDGPCRQDGDVGQPADLQSMVVALRADLESAEREIERLRSLDASRYAEATGEYRRKVAELAAEIEKRDKGIARLKRRRGELIGQVRELADECARLRSGLVSAESANAELRNEAARADAEREQWRTAYGAVMDGVFELQRFGRLMPDETVTGQGDARRMPSDG